MLAISRSNSRSFGSTPFPGPGRNLTPSPIPGRHSTGTLPQRSPDLAAPSSSNMGVWLRNVMFALLACTMMSMFFLHSLHENKYRPHSPDGAPSGDLLNSFHVLHSPPHAGRNEVPQLHYYSSFRQGAGIIHYTRDVVLSTSTADELPLDLASAQHNNVGSSGHRSGNTSAPVAGIACSLPKLSIRAEVAAPDVMLITAVKLLEKYLGDHNQYQDVCPASLMRGTRAQSWWSKFVGYLEIFIGPLHDRAGVTLPMELLDALHPPVPQDNPFNTTGLPECSKAVLWRFCANLARQSAGEGIGGGLSSVPVNNSEAETDAKDDHGFAMDGADIPTDDGVETVAAAAAAARAAGDRRRALESDLLTGNSSVDMSNMLIVLTACNQLNTTLTALEHMKLAFGNKQVGTMQHLTIEKPPALLIVDDNSNDNTTDILRAMGYFVVRTTTARGVTYSWNLGYKIAKLLGRYKYVVFMNNDVLVPKGSMELLHAALKRHPLVVPTTSFKGSGHNPRQALTALLPVLFEEGSELRVAAQNRFHRLDFYLTNPLCVQPVQDMLLRMRNERLLNLYNNSEDLQALYEHDFTLASARVRKEWTIGMFNGFMFGINIAQMARHGLAYDDSKNIFFDPSMLMIGQENRLAFRMSQLGIMPRIEPYAFMYHFKSMTVKVFGQMAVSEQTVNNVTVKVDVRNNLAMYHGAQLNHSVYEALDFMDVHPPFDTRGQVGAHAVGTAVEVDQYRPSNICECKVLCPPTVHFAGIQSNLPCQSVRPVKRKVKRGPKYKHNAQKPRICVGIRSAPPGRRQKRVRNLMYSFLAMYSQSALAPDTELRLFIGYSQSDNSLFRISENASQYELGPAYDMNGTAVLYTSSLKKAVDIMNLNAEMKTKLSMPFAQMISPKYMEYFNRSRFSRFYNRYYGYFMADLLLDHMLVTAPKFGIECDWIALTDGDVIFENTWFDAIASIALNSIGTDRVRANRRGKTKKEVVDMIGWSIEKKKGAVTVPFTPNDKDRMNIGSMLVRRHLFTTPYTDVCFLNNRAALVSGQPLPVCDYEAVKFLPNSLMSGEFLARDFFTLRSLIRNSLRLLHLGHSHDAHRHHSHSNSTTEIVKLTHTLRVLPEALSKIPGM